MRPTQMTNVDPIEDSRLTSDAIAAMLEHVSDARVMEMIKAMPDAKIIVIDLNQITQARAQSGDELPRIRLMNNERITSRELQVVECISEGLSNKDIACRLNIATHTVKSHVRNVMEKLALHTRLQIAAHFRRIPVQPALEYKVA
jgi:DNA-binding NarL/FixJ family response regulator